MCMRSVFTRALTCIIAQAEMLIHYTRICAVHKFTFSKRVYFSFRTNYRHANVGSLQNEALKSLGATHLQIPIVADSSFVRRQR